MRSCLCLGLLLALGCTNGNAPADDRPASLGATLRSPSSEAGPVLADFDEAGPAARAGLRPGDRLLALDGQPVHGDCDLDRLLLARHPDQKVTLTVRRGSETWEKSVKLASALTLHGKACSDGRAAGCYELGLLYIKGRGVPADPERANRFLDQACRGGSAAGCAELGGRYLQGYGGIGDMGGIGGMAGDSTILSLLRKACEGGSPAGCAHLAFLYATGRGVVQDDDRAFRLYQSACDGGDAAGCYNVGLHYEKGRGALENVSLALLAYGRACDLGSSLGCTNLAFLHERGLGSPQDPEHVASLYRRACDGNPCAEGDPLACFNLGVLFRDGKGLAVDKAQAASLFEKSCAGHNAFGCANLADLLYAGDGVPEDKPRAAALFAEACKGGHAFACRNTVGLNAATGKPEAAAAALERLERACQKREAAACHYLGDLYGQGIGVAPDRVRAVAYYRQACDGGDEESCAKVN